jgi:starch phosphorylase
MVREYYELCYEPSAGRSHRLAADEFQRAKDLAAWKSQMRKHWKEIHIERVWTNGPGEQELEVGDHLRVQAEVRLGSVDPTDVSVELYYGPLNSEGMIVSGQSMPMLIAQSDDDGCYTFAGALSCESSGRHGYALRLMPKHEDTGDPFEMRLITWGL